MLSDAARLTYMLPLLDGEFAKLHRGTTNRALRRDCNFVQLQKKEKT